MILFLHRKVIKIEELKSQIIFSGHCSNYLIEDLDENHVKEPKIKFIQRKEKNYTVIF